MVWLTEKVIDLRHIFAQNIFFLNWKKTHDLHLLL